MFEQYVGLNGYLGSTDRAVLLANGSGGLTAQASELTLSAKNCLTIPGSAITADEPLLNLSQVWNNAGVAFTGLKFNATDNASASGSLLADFQIGGSSKFSVRKDGVLTTGKVAASGSYVYGAPQFYSSTYGTNVGMQIKANNEIAFYCSGTAVASVNYNSGITLGSTNSIGWVNGHAIANPPDLFLYRDAANTLALRNGVNAQAFNIYNTWGNSGTDYERLFVGWTGNYCYLTTQRAGTGFARSIIVGTEGVTAMYLRTGGLDRWSVSSSGHFTAVTDNAYDIGFSGSQRPRTGYFGTSLNVASGTLTASEPLLNLSQTWNNAGVAFTGIKFNATDTASASDSLLADFQVGGSSKFSVRKDGLVFSQSAIRGTDINATSSIGQLSINFDTIITRDAANTLALRNGVNAQAFNIYNTWGNSGTDYERLSLYWSSNIGYLTTGKGGTGAGRHLRLDTSASGDLYLGTAGTLRYFISGNTGVFTPAVTNTYDLGNSSLTFARGYFGTSVVTPNVTFGNGTILTDDAANTLALRNGVNAQAFSIYNTWGNSGTDYERLKIFWSGNTCFIDTQAGGTGSNRVLDIGGGGSDLKLTTGNNLILQTSGHVARLYLASSGHILWISDNTLDIGQSGANRPRNGYFGTSVNVASGTITANTPMLNLSQTWNNAGVNFQGVLIDITSTASASGSYPLHIKVNGATRTYLDRDGNIGATGQLICTNCTNYGWLKIGNNAFLYGTAADVLEQRNGVNAQAFNIYNTWGNSGTDYERLNISYSGNVAYIQTANGGTGLARQLVIGTKTASNLTFCTNDNNRWGVQATTGAWYANSDNSYDIGINASSNRPRTGYFGTSLNVASGTIAASTPLLVLSQTWNSAGTLFDGITFDVTDSGGSSASSTLLRLRVGGSNMFRVYKSGSIESASTIISGASVGVGAGNAYLSAVSSHVLELRNGVNPQTFGVYNTYTSSTNYERLTQTWATNVCQLWTEKGSGGGTARDLVLGADSTELVRFQTGSKIGFFGVTPVARPAAYTVTNGATDRTYDASATTVGELANVLSTLLADLKALGLVA